jgi:hypothetical protein
VTDYDETAVLTHYVWEHYQHLMTDFERRVGAAIIARTKAAASSSEDVGRLLNKRWGAEGNPEIDAALSHGHEVFRRRVCERVLTDNGGEVFVNRCSRCARVVRTPKASQCFWCGHDWHGGRG